MFREKNFSHKYLQCRTGARPDCKCYECVLAATNIEKDFKRHVKRSERNYIKRLIGKELIDLQSPDPLPQSEIV